MLDRQTLVVVSLAMTTVRPSIAAGKPDAKARAIDGIALPPSFDGALAYGRGGMAVHLRCVGMADVEAGRPVTAATHFKWGSASKWAASAAMLRSGEQGHVSLDAPIAT